MQAYIKQKMMLVPFLLAELESFDPREFLKSLNQKIVAIPELILVKKKNN